jgi:hypothetical protein
MKKIALLMPLPETRRLLLFRLRQKVPEDLPRVLLVLLRLSRLMVPLVLLRLSRLMVPLVLLRLSLR